MFGAGGCSFPWLKRSVACFGLWGMCIHAPFNTPPLHAGSLARIKDGCWRATYVHPLPSPCMAPATFTKNDPKADFVVIELAPLARALLCSSSLNDFVIRCEFRSSNATLTTTPFIHNHFSLTILPFFLLGVLNELVDHSQIVRFVSSFISDRLTGKVRDVVLMNMVLHSYVGIRQQKRGISNG